MKDFRDLLESAKFFQPGQQVRLPIWSSRETEHVLQLFAHQICENWYVFFEELGRSNAAEAAKLSKDLKNLFINEEYAAITARFLQESRPNNCHKPLDCIAALEGIKTMDEFMKAVTGNDSILYAKNKLRCMTSLNFGDPVAGEELRKAFMQTIRAAGVKTAQFKENILKFLGVADFSQINPQNVPQFLKKLFNGG